MSWNREIEYLGLKSKQDLGLVIRSKKIGNPDKIKNLVRVPYSNDEIDVSNLYGSPVYSKRTIEYEFNLIDYWNNDIKMMSSIKTRILNAWARATGKTPLYDRWEIDGYHYMAELVEAPVVSESQGTAIMTVRFDCYPFKISDSHEGTDLWDPFNFELDVFQDTSFTINGPTSIPLVNNGASFVVPTIRVNITQPIKLTIGGFTYQFDKSGDYKRQDLFLPVGESTIQADGVGTVQFIWYKELI